MKLRSRHVFKSTTRSNHHRKDITLGALAVEQHTTVAPGPSPTRRSDYAAMLISSYASMNDKNFAVLRYVGPILRHILLTLNTQDEDQTCG